MQKHNSHESFLMLLAITLVHLAVPVAALAAPCTDGVDCFCDRLAGPDIVLCEDFESSHLAVRSFADRAHPESWMSKYGPSVNQCLHNRTSPEFYTGFGIDNTLDCLDQVNESTATMSAGGCGVVGETDCVLDGNYALGHRARFQRNGGSTGIARFTGGVQRTFGISIALKYSTNYEPPGSSADSGPAHKGNEWGERNAGLLGVGTGNSGRNIPWGGFTQGPIPANANALLGTVSYSSTAMSFSPDRSVYNYGVNTGDGPGNWECIQVHWRNWGTSNATLRVWMNNTLALHLTNIDMSGITWSRNGIGSMSWNDYYNGRDNQGYAATSTAYRYEDNLIVTKAEEPVSCAQLGFGGGGPVDTTPPDSPTDLSVE